MSRVEEALEYALRFGVLNNFSGPDPYDGLNSPFAAYLRGRVPRQAWVQAHKRGGKALRAITGVRDIRMAKTLALFGHGCVLAGKEELATRLVDDLLSAQEGGPWGYEFDVQTRWAYYKKNSPNVVATAYALRAIDAAGRIDEVSEKVANWLQSLWDGQNYFLYTPASSALIHNGNLLAVESLARLGRIDSTLEKAVGTTLSSQGDDGSWTYGRGAGLEWKDSFHTVYVLDSLKLLASKGLSVESELAQGTEYWLNHFFTADGLPTYFSDQTTASTDIHNISTVLGGLVEHSQESTTLSRVANRLLNFQQPDGSFSKSRNGITFMRWNQGHAFLAFSKLANYGEVRESNDQA